MIINKLRLNIFVQKAIEIILGKKELSGISEDIVRKEIDRKLTPKIKKIIIEERFKSGEFKRFVKEIRSQLRRQFGAFNNPKVDREKLIKKRDYEKLLLSHKSSRERMPYYKEVYEKIFFGIKNASIIDLGCGLNPLSIEYMPIKIDNYLALDIGKKDLEIINEYFSQKGINGKAVLFDATNLDNYRFKKKFDYCFAFKVFEIFEKTNSHRLTEDIILRIPAKIIVASFSTETLGGIRMKRMRRIWFDVMATRLGYTISSFKVQNEIFYILKSIVF